MDLKLPSDEQLRKMCDLIEHENRSIKGALAEFGIPYRYYFIWKREMPGGGPWLDLEAAYDRNRAQIKGAVKEGSDNRAKVSLIKLESRENERDRRRYLGPLDGLY